MRTRLGCEPSRLRYLNPHDREMDAKYGVKDKVAREAEALRSA